MNRRNFLSRSLLVIAGASTLSTKDVIAKAVASDAAGLGGKQTDTATSRGLYKLFQQPANDYYPFVRWWWNGDKVEGPELKRELALLHEAKVGGVEINPISFPAASVTDDLGIKGLTWLSDEWMEMLNLTFGEAKRLGMTCDLIVGSGWPYGNENLPLEERAQVVILNAQKIKGPVTFEESAYSLALEVDPGVTTKNPRRTAELISLKLVPNPMEDMSQIIDLDSQLGQQTIKFDVPEGEYYFYAVIRYDSFAQVINGAPGAAGSILDHMNAEAVRKYLNNMSDTIQAKLGPLSNNVRALFTDSMELEGTNWCSDFREEFQKRNGYDIMPYLPFIMFKVGRLGDVQDFNYGAQKGEALADTLRRVRFDFEFTKAQLLRERYNDEYIKWCQGLGVKSRAQSYGRGFFPLESSLGYDIPEGESWTTNWLRHVVGEEMSDEDYRRGRGYTMIDKYVSSAAHLEGKRLVSCEEMTNTYNVFFTSLEYLKVGSDMAAQSGITHSVWHGFNYSPKEAPFPGWIQYGSYYNENNTWWPYFKYLNTYRARLCSQLQNADMFTDIAILPANYDMWGEMGVQTEPFPVKLNVPYTSIIWESINKTGGAADYTSEIVLENSSVKKGCLCYGPKKYSTLILPKVTSISPSVMGKIEMFVKDGGKVICIEEYPSKTPGMKDAEIGDAMVKSCVERLKSGYPERFVMVPKPEDNKFLEWYQEVMVKYALPHYMEIGTPDRFVMQTRYIRDDGSEMYFFNNCSRIKGHTTKVKFPAEAYRGRNCWVWDIESGDRFRLALDKSGAVTLDFGPSESLIVVFDKEQGGEFRKPLPTSSASAIDLSDGWDVEFNHQYEGTTQTIRFDSLCDLKDREDTKHFAGKAVYRKTVTVDDPAAKVLNLGKVEGICQVFVNGSDCGVKWFGNRIYDISKYLVKGENLIEIHLVTIMGNYLKSIKDNKMLDRWVARRNHPYYAQGVIGPVQIYNK
ncbi:MAG: glycoside hydrolase family 2 [Bacteroidales bacterium]|nr:glycoside hydrolase family 2 [Bacteroidales bacterium]